MKIPGFDAEPMKPHQEVIGWHVIGNIETLKQNFSRNKRNRELKKKKKRKKK